MLALRVFEIAAGILAIVFFVFQVVIPLWKGRPTFPFFRSEKKLRSDLRDVTEYLETVKAKQHIEEIQSQADAIKQNLKSKD